MRGARCPLAGDCCYHARTALCDQHSPAARARRAAGRGAGPAIQGVARCGDAVVVAEEAAAYVKVDTQQVDRTALERLAQAAPGGC